MRMKQKFNRTAWIRDLVKAMHKQDAPAITKLCAARAHFRNRVHLARTRMEWSEIRRVFGLEFYRANFAPDGFNGATDLMHCGGTAVVGLGLVEQAKVLGDFVAKYVTEVMVPDEEGSDLMFVSRAV